jgi:hypothetical protein
MQKRRMARIEIAFHRLEIIAVDDQLLHKAMTVWCVKPFELVSAYPKIFLYYSRFLQCDIVWDNDHFETGNSVRKRFPRANETVE